MQAIRWRLGITTLALMSSLACASEIPFYRGGQDANKATAPNGAVVNADYLKWFNRQSDIRVIELRPKVHTIVGYHLANCTIIEGSTGLIVIDTGTKVGHGKDLRRLIHQFSDKPIKAVIYTHHHYVGGSRGLLENENVEGIQVFAHPQMEALTKTSVGLLGPMQLRRVGIQFGAYLPNEGPDASLMLQEKVFSEPELSISGPLKVTHPVADGEEVTVDGIKIRFHHIVADTRDSLAIEFPDLDTVVANSALADMAYPLYTLRGDYFRQPDDLIAGLDLLRKINPQYLIPVHGHPYTDKTSALAALTAHRDAYAFIWNQSLRAINLGMTPDQMVASIHLPEHLAKAPSLFPAYSDWEFAIRGIYRGMVGWYSEDAADLYPPSSAELGQTIVDASGGADSLLGQARKALNHKKYNLAAKLMSFLLAAQPANKEAHKIKADALRAMAQATPTGVQARDFILTQALELEGKTNSRVPTTKSMFSPPTVQSLQTKPAKSLIKQFEMRIDAQAADALQTSVAFDIEGQGTSMLELRRGVAEFVDQAPADANIRLSMNSQTLAELVLRQTSLGEEIKAGAVTVAGDKTLVPQLEKSLVLTRR